jgi:prolyl-tRNA editing enzyme YbaK/EbsC (Cys-tRNA(Pro) deacylase)
MNQTLDINQVRELLPKGTDYVIKHAESLEISMKILEHDTPTNTCYEKAELLGWNPFRVIKTLYFHNKDKMYGFITPETGLKINPKIFKILGISESFTDSQKFTNGTHPEGMEHGTCTPFIGKQSFEKGLEGIFIQDTGQLWNIDVDISIGGTGKQAHKLSMHLQYGAIYDILHSEFGDKIRKTNLYPVWPESFFK